MGARLYTTANRAAHLGPYPLERLARLNMAPDLSGLPAFQPISFSRPDAPQNIVNAMAEATGEDAHNEREEIITELKALREDIAALRKAKEAE